MAGSIGLPDPVGCLMNSRCICEVSLAPSWVEEPNVGDAERKVFLNLFLQRTHCVVWRKDFDAEQRRLREDLFTGWSGNDANVGYSKTVRPDLDPLFGNSENPQTIFKTHQILQKHGLEPAVIPLTHVALREDSIEILAVGLVGFRQVFGEGHQYLHYREFGSRAKCRIIYGIMYLEVTLGDKPHDLA